MRRPRKEPFPFRARSENPVWWLFREIKEAYEQWKRARDRGDGKWERHWALELEELGERATRLAVEGNDVVREIFAASLEGPARDLPNVHDAMTRAGWRAEWRPPAK